MRAASTILAFDLDLQARLPHFPGPSRQAAEWKAELGRGTENMLDELSPPQWGSSWIVVLLLLHRPPGRQPQSTQLPSKN
ncbi:unnamed protein product, partial [Prorocentrum cordatum]